MFLLYAFNLLMVSALTNVKVLGLVKGPSFCSARRYSVRLLVACGRRRDCSYSLPSSPTFCIDRSPSAGMEFTGKLESEELLVEVPSVLEVLGADSTDFCRSSLIEFPIPCKDKSPSADIGSARNGLDALLFTRMVDTSVGHEVPGSSCCMGTSLSFAFPNVSCLVGAQSLVDSSVATPFPSDGIRFERKRDWRRVNRDVVFFEEEEQLGFTSLIQSDAVDSSSPPFSILIPSLPRATRVSKSSRASRTACIEVGYWSSSIWSEHAETVHPRISRSGIPSISPAFLSTMAGSGNGDTDIGILLSNVTSTECNMLDSNEVCLGKF